MLAWRYTFDSLALGLNMTRIDENLAFGLLDLDDCIYGCSHCMLVWRCTFDSLGQALVRCSWHEQEWNPGMKLRLRTVILVKRMMTMMTSWHQHQWWWHWCQEWWQRGRHQWQQVPLGGRQETNVPVMTHTLLLLYQPCHTHQLLLGGGAINVIPLGHKNARPSCYCYHRPAQCVLHNSVTMYYTHQ